MHIPKHIVLATDLTLAADPAMTVAARFAKALKMGLTIFHVFQYVPRHEYHVPVDWMVYELRRKVELKLDSMRQTLADLQIEAHVSVVEDGDPSREILSFLSGIDSPLVVMGTHASAGIERFILGSTAEAVLRQVLCPAVTVGPFAEASELDQFRRILIASDEPEDLDGLVRNALPLLHPICGILEILHVISSPDEPMPFADREALVAALEQKGIGRNRIRFQKLHGKSVAQAVVNEAERDSTELIVLGARGSSEAATHVAPGLAIQIVAAAPCPVLTLRRSSRSEAP
jgi:nucleotide-binding universal stress UspA family protein